MSYAAQADMEDRFGEAEVIDLTDRAEPPAGAVDTTVLQAALDDADGIINSYIALQYALPLTSTPRTIALVACDIARYLLWDDRASEEVLRRYEAALSWLRDVAAGSVLLLDANGLPLAGANETYVTRGVAIASEPQHFTADLWALY